MQFHIVIHIICNFLPFYWSNSTLLSLHLHAPKHSQHCHSKRGSTLICWSISYPTTSHRINIQNILKGQFYTWSLVYSSKGVLLSLLYDVFCGSEGSFPKYEEIGLDWVWYLRLVTESLSCKLGVCGVRKAWVFTSPGGSNKRHHGVASWESSSVSRVWPIRKKMDILTYAALTLNCWTSLKTLIRFSLY